MKNATVEVQWRYGIDKYRATAKEGTIYLSTEAFLIEQRI
jgi:hypothetical protein